MAAYYSIRMRKFGDRNNMKKREYDAIVVGSGPNGFAAAITLQRAGLSVLLIEGKDTIGGGMRTAELTLPGFHHDICSAIHPLAIASPFFKSLPLDAHGLKFVEPIHAAAHPFDDGTAAILNRSISETAESLLDDGPGYAAWISRLSEIWPSIDNDVLGPFGIPKNIASFTSFGLHAILPATQLASRFKGERAKGLWAGMAGHALQPLSNIASSGIGLVLLIAGHLYNWPMALGGSQRIAHALESYFESLGGEIVTGFTVKSLADLPPAKSVLFDVTPKQLLKIAGEEFGKLYTWRMNRFRYGMGVFKIDWALREPIPFTSDECRKSGTLHLGNTLNEIADSEWNTAKGRHADKPFVLLSQPTVFDTTRAPEGKHTAWAYCHVPNGSTKDMTLQIEDQVERFAPGFKDTIIERSTMNTAAFERYNPNYIGGDINGGVIDITQLFTRPILQRSPYRTAKRGIYLCSSSTPPGGGVHGMCGLNAAQAALRDIFGIKSNALQEAGKIISPRLYR